MKRKIRLSSGIIAGSDMLSLVEILPQLKDSFRQRKEFFEYYFDETEVTLSLEDIDKLSLSLPQLAGNIRENLLQLQLLLPDNINSMLNQTINQAEMYIANFIHNTIKAIFEFLSNALQIIIVPVLTFYFIKDGAN